MIPLKWKKEVKQYLYPDQDRKFVDEERIKPNLDDQEYRDFFLEEAVRSLTNECNDWSICYTEFKLIFTPFQSMKGGSIKALLGNPNLKRALIIKINQLGFPTSGRDLRNLDYCLSVVGIKLFSTKIEDLEEVSYKGRWFWKRAVTKSNKRKVSYMKSREEILKELN